MKTYFPALTGVRAVAAYMIVLVHLAAREAPAKLPYFKLLVVEYMLQWHIGVVIFFVLSGFLITTRYAARMEPSWAWFGRYLRNRFARIYPIYFLLTMLTFAVMLVQPTHGWWEWNATFSIKEKLGVFLLNITLLRAYFNQFSVLGLPTAWSLTVEETFYLSAPLLLIGLRHHPRLLVAYPLAIMALGFLLVAFCSRFLPYHGLMQDARFMLNITFFGHGTEFILGMGLALWAARQPLSTGTRITYTVVGTGGIALYMLLLSVLRHYSLLPRLAAAQGFDSAYALIAARNLFLPMLVCSLLWGLISERTYLRQLLETRLLGLLGKASYGLYLLHLGTFDYLFRRYVTSNDLLCLLAYTAVSILLYKTVEHPLQARLRARPTGGLD